MKPYRSIDFNDERKWKSNHEFDDVLQVGIKKSIGYIFTDNKNDLLFPKFKDYFIQKGKLVELRSESKLYSYNILWVGDKDMIQSIINSHKELLEQNNWISDSEWIFKKICNEHIDHDKNEKLYHMITELFNSWCLWCEPRAIAAPDGLNFLSENPYDPDSLHE